MKTTVMWVFVCALGLLLVGGCARREQHAAAPRDDSYLGVTSQQPMLFTNRDIRRRGTRPFRRDPRLAPPAAGVEAVQPATRPAGLNDYVLTGPFIHANLTVFLVHAETPEPRGEYRTLQEAIEAGKLVVHETGNVSQLAVENKDPKVSVFIQSGDIVKGGRQDRVLAFDLLVPPSSGKVALASFCVESGRWHQRGYESETTFSASPTMLVGKDLKLAAKHRGSQQRVWRGVQRTQARLEPRVGGFVADLESATSLQLSLEHPRVKKAVEKYIAKLAGVAKGKENAVGMVFAVNGEINSADIYTSAELFTRLWPRLLDSAATEAFRDFEKGKQFDPLEAAAVRKWFAGIREGRISARNLGKGVQLINQETDRDVLFDTILLPSSARPGNGGAPVLLHRNMIRKPKGGASTDPVGVDSNRVLGLPDPEAVTNEGAVAPR